MGIVLHPRRNTENNSVHGRMARIIVLLKDCRIILVLVFKGKKTTPLDFSEMAKRIKISNPQASF